MGRIKSIAIKKAAKVLILREQGLTHSFAKNKEILKKYEFPDKGTRNKIAGYISRVKRYEEQKNIKG
ncbi:MAG: 30S ribosomal protein S17e [Candidatus Pacearchaeota archaeon]